jgi:hypothetical protein
MKLEDQVVSLELAKQLKELGVPQDSLWDWIKSGDNYFVDDIDNVIDLGTYTYSRIAAAFTVAELGEMLVNLYGRYEVCTDWLCSAEVREKCAKEADSRAHMILKLLDDQHICAGELKKSS